MHERRVRRLQDCQSKTTGYSGFDGVHQIVLQTSCSNESRGGEDPIRVLRGGSRKDNSGLIS